MEVEPNVSRQPTQSNALESKLHQAVTGITELLKTPDSHNRAIEKIVNFQGGRQITRFTLLQLVIATGQKTRNRQLIQVGVDAFEKLKSKLPKDDPMLYYNIATGYQELYDFQLQEDGANIFDCEDTITSALKFAGRAPVDDSRVLTNLGNLYDEIGRPVEAIDCYERALRIDGNFGMALGNKAIAIQTLAPIVRYPTGYYIYAHQLYQAAFAQEQSVLAVGGQAALEVFQAHDRTLVEWFTLGGQADRLDQDLRHGRYDDAAMSAFVKFYTEFCIRHDLYLNTHLVDRLAPASIGDSVVPRLVTRPDDEDEQYVNDIMFRLSEITEAYITARMALVQSQYTNDDFSTISNQTTLVNLLDYSVSNIYVGHLKTAYKEAFGALDKIAVLVNHYLGLGLKEDRCYYRSVWYEHDEAGEPIQPTVVAQKIKDQGYRLFGLYLLCQELCGSKYSYIRNALTHRYVRVYRAVAGPKGTYTFEDLTQTTIDALYKIKCAIMYVSLFIETKEQAKRGDETGSAIDMPLNTDQNLDIW